MAFQYLAPQIIRVRLPHCIRSRDIIQSLYSIYEFALNPLGHIQWRPLGAPVSVSKVLIGISSQVAIGGQPYARAYVMTKDAMSTTHDFDRFLSQHPHRALLSIQPL
jgi:hypothetical protein